MIAEAAIIDSRQRLVRTVAMTGSPGRIIAATLSSLSAIFTGTPHVGPSATESRLARNQGDDLFLFLCCRLFRFRPPRDGSIASAGASLFSCKFGGPILSSL